MPREEVSDDEPDVEWNLGYAEPPERATDLLRHRFPSKIGGRPAWLDPVHLPTSQQLTCAVTGTPMRFLLQVYSPHDNAPHAFHRTIYVFVSPRGDKLAEPGAVRALRCQAPRVNPWYPFEAPGPGDVVPPTLKPEEAETAVANDPWRSYTAERIHAAISGAAAGTPGDSKSKSSGSTTAEVAPGGNSSVRPGAGGPKLFREFELVVEEEPEEDEEAPEVARVLSAYRERVEAEGEYDDEELPADVMDALEDRTRAHFASFQARCARAPEQCLRYCFQPGAAPLWPSLEKQPQNVPPCPGCGKPRQFEFQIMPQLINFLGENEEDPHSPDWGAIAVYSCPDSCEAAIASSGSSAYAEEFVWVQPAQ